MSRAGSTCLTLFRTCTGCVSLVVHVSLTFRFRTTWCPQLCSRLTCHGCPAGRYRAVALPLQTRRSRRHKVCRPHEQSRVPDFVTAVSVTNILPFFATVDAEAVFWRKRSTNQERATKSLDWAVAVHFLCRAVRWPMLLAMYRAQRVKGWSLINTCGGCQAFSRHRHTGYYNLLLAARVGACGGERGRSGSSDRCP